MTTSNPFAPKPKEKEGFWPDPLAGLKKEIAEALEKAGTEARAMAQESLAVNRKQVDLLGHLNETLLLILDELKAKR